MSLDSHNENIHDSIVGIKGAWKKTVTAIQELLKYVPSRIRYLRVNYVMTSKNYSDVCKFIEFANEVGFKDIKFLPYETSHDEEQDKELSLNDQQMDHLNRKIIPSCVALSEKYGIVTNLSKIFCGAASHGDRQLSHRNEIQLKIPCFHPFFRIDVDRKGDVYPCCEIKDDQHLMGNIFEQDVDEIINGECFREFKLGLIPPLKYPQCEVCWSVTDDNLGDS